MRSAFIGIDVAIAKGKPIPIVVSVQEERRLIPQRLRTLSAMPPRGAGNIAVLDPVWRQNFAVGIKQYLLCVCERLGLVPARIAIDAPSLPRAAFIHRRAAEVALDHAGISCFATPSAVDFEQISDKVKQHLASGGNETRIPHSNQLWMLAGFALFKELIDVAECLEVFPQAIIRMAGSGQMHKSARGAVDQQLEAASHYTGWPTMRAGDPILSEIAWGSAHDQLDAYLSSWVASLSENDRVAFGQQPNDAVWVPKLVEPASLSARTGGSRTASMSRDLDDHAPRALFPIAPLVCPACGKHSFKRWPWGWDRHAAHKCSGLSAAEPEARKSEFRQRFADHF